MKYLQPILLLALPLAGCAVSGDTECLQAPQFVEPQSAQSPKLVFNVDLQREPGRPCISYVPERSNTTLLMSRRLLQHLVQNGEQDALNERMGLRGNLLERRALGILNSASTQLDHHGCERINGGIPADSNYLLASMLASGQVAAVYNQTGEKVSKLTVRYEALAGAPGQVEYALPKGYEQSHVLSMPTWVR
ncbi:hypothetical protein [Pseudoduganella violacea]|uniref:Lipoprotein n=1 Tax=Pseudoduganella violacea TaxID=1715466 RepID=A0A7W5FTL3_9BURK|nr:hypothetical protein [Pseudoduganella violacea]MBB3118701.1 hypothetical protein [Pseudoduganella violacea]